MKMNKSIQFLSVMLFALMFSTVAQAQSGTTPARNKSSKSSEMKSKDKGDSMADELKLTPEQRAQFKKADDDYKMKAKAAKSDKKEDMTRMRAERTRAHKSVLTSEQSAKYDQIMARKDAKRAQKDHKGPKKGKSDKVKKENNGAEKGERSRGEKAPKPASGDQR